jgi:CBS domain containing-hemolysin-like protein
MVPLNEVFMVKSSELLDDDNIKRIVASGFSRIPVYEDDKHDVVGMLYVRDLVNVALNWSVDSPPSTVRNVMRISTGVVFMPDTTIGDAFSEFKIGRSHMALVRKPPTLDAPASVVGIVTINDVMELIVQSKIIGEDHSLQHIHPAPSTPTAVTVTTAFPTDVTPLLRDLH